MVCSLLNFAPRHLWLAGSPRRPRPSARPYWNATTSAAPRRTRAVRRDPTVLLSSQFNRGKEVAHPAHQQLHAGHATCHSDHRQHPPPPSPGRPKTSTSGSTYRSMGERQPHPIKSRSTHPRAAPTRFPTSPPTSPASPPLPPAPSWSKPQPQQSPQPRNRASFCSSTGLRSLPPHVVPLAVEKSTGTPK